MAGSLMRSKPAPGVRQGDNADEALDCRIQDELSDLIGPVLFRLHFRFGWNGPCEEGPGGALEACGDRSAREPGWEKSGRPQDSLRMGASEKERLRASPWVSGSEQRTQGEYSGALPADGPANVEVARKDSCAR